MIDAGEMRDRLGLMVLEAQREETCTRYVWTAVRWRWAKVVLTGKTCYFSKIGLGARAAEITIRDVPLDLHHAIRWRDMHLLPTEITRPERGLLVVQAAVTDLTRWTLLGDGRPDVSFPAAITEKYVRYAQEEPMASHSTTYVLVTPKSVVMGPSDLVATGAGESREVYVVGACHTLDPWKNEYEITRREEP